tara:strand:- start:852 stop:1127 length:276 start_codon:yes stop_codon:yes gene_type:complete
MELTNNNKLIAEFMNHEYRCDAHGNTYHNSWDWLMPVVERIESLGYWVNRNDGDVTIYNKNDIVVITPMSSGGIDMMYKAVIEFINQYNNE